MVNSFRDLVDSPGQKEDSIYLGVQPKVFKKEYNRHLCLAEKLNRGEADPNQFMPLKNHLVIAAENVGREESLSPVLILTMLNDMEEKLAHNVVHIVEHPWRRICVTLLRYNLDKPKCSYARRKRMRSFNILSM